MDGRAVDALACRADEGRGDAAKHLGEWLPHDEPRVPEWSNPPRLSRGTPTRTHRVAWGNRGN